MKNFFLIMAFLLSPFYHVQALDQEGARLQATLSFADSTSARAKPEKIVPGSLINLRAKVKNMGTDPSESGVIYVRFVFLEPLGSHQKSLLFQTEKVSLPVLEPHQEVDVDFKTHHQWPSFFDYIREDWPMRHYEAVVVINDQEHIIGSIGVAISAHYYQGLVDELPKQVPACYRIIE